MLHLENKVMTLMMITLKLLIAQDCLFKLERNQTKWRIFVHFHCQCYVHAHSRVICSTPTQSWISTLVKSMLKVSTTRICYQFVGGTTASTVSDSVVNAEENSGRTSAVD